MSRVALRRRVQPPSGPTRSAVAARRDAPRKSVAVAVEKEPVRPRVSVVEHALERRRDRRRAASGRASHCLAASRATRSQPRRANPRSRGKTACARSSTIVDAVGAELRRLLDQPREPFGAEARDEEGDRSVIRGRLDDATRPSTSASPRGAGDDLGARPRGRCRRARTTGSPARQPPRARVRGLLARKSRRFLPAPEAPATIRRARDVTHVQPFSRAAARQRPAAASAAARTTAASRSAGIPETTSRPPARHARADARPHREELLRQQVRDDERERSRSAATGPQAARATRDPNGCSARFSRATKTACGSVSKPTARRAPSAAAASARTPEPGPDVEHVQALERLLLERERARAASTRGRRCRRRATPAARSAIRPRGRRGVATGRPDRSRNGRPTGEGPRRGAVGLERILLGDVRDRSWRTRERVERAAGRARGRRRRESRRRGRGPRSSKPSGS